MTLSFALAAMSFSLVGAAEAQFAAEAAALAASGRKIAAEIAAAAGNSILASLPDYIFEEILAARRAERTSVPPVGSPLFQHIGAEPTPPAQEPPNKTPPAGGHSGATAPVASGLAAAAGDATAIGRTDPEQSQSVSMPIGAASSPAAAADCCQPCDDPTGWNISGFGPLGR